MRACMSLDACKYVRLFAFVGCKIRNEYGKINARPICRPERQRGLAVKIWGQNAN